MSRVGKLPVIVPAGVDVSISGNHISIKCRRSLESDAQYTGDSG